MTSAHPHEAPAGAPWERCVHCGLAEAAHDDAVEPYRPRARRPDALDVVCPHCGAPIAEPCVSPAGHRRPVHKRRLVYALNGGRRAA